MYCYYALPVRAIYGLRITKKNPINANFCTIYMHYDFKLTLSEGRVVLSVFVKNYIAQESYVTQ